MFKSNAKTDPDGACALDLPDEGTLTATQSMAAVRGVRTEPMFFRDKPGVTSRSAKESAMP